MQKDANHNSQIIKPWWKDPLLHFIAIGLLVFAIDKFTQTESVEENVILIDGRLKNELIQQFQIQNKRVPKQNELDQILDTWLQTELLYRRGLTLGLDKNDPVIRERVLQKTEFLLKNLTNLKEPSEHQLREWYKTKASNYQKPPQYDFEHVLVRKQSENAQQQVEDVLQKIVAGTVAQSFEQDYHAFVARNRIGLQVSFGEAFVDKLDQLPTNKWQIIQSNKGWHVVRVQAKQQAPLPPFEKIAPLLRSDWYKQQQREQIVNLINELRDSYIIRYQSS